MKKTIFTLAATLFAGVMFAQTELVDFSKITLNSWGGSGAPVMTLDAANKTVTIEIVGTPGYQWGNQAMITLDNVAESGLDIAKLYKLSFTATASTADCGGVTLKFFDNNQLFYTDANYLNFSSAYNYESEWIQPEAAATNGKIVLDFGWDPAQTVTITNLSFLEKENSSTALDNIGAETNVQKVVENGQVLIIRDGVRYNTLGAQVK